MCKDEFVAYLTASFKREIGFEAASVIGGLRRVLREILLVICAIA